MPLLRNIWGQSMKICDIELSSNSIKYRYVHGIHASVFNTPCFIASSFCYWQICYIPCNISNLYFPSRLTEFLNNFGGFRVFYPNKTQSALHDNRSSNPFCGLCRWYGCRNPHARPGKTTAGFESGAGCHAAANGECQRRQGERKRQKPGYTSLCGIQGWHYVWRR